MLYNKESLPHYVRTAGKITVATALTGLFVFLVAFMFDVGTRELSHVSANTASTTLFVLNTPPAFTQNAYEVPDSSTTTPTNSGDVIQWAAVARDSNGAPYFLLLCEQNVAPIAASTTGALGTAPPRCANGVKQWGVSAAASSGDMAIVSTTTFEGGPFATSTTNVWYAWVCDDDPILPRCNTTAVQGPTSTTASSSPFHINSRPIFSAFGNTGPFDPGDLATFISTSSDPDLVGGEDDIFMTVCQSAGWNSATDTCTDPADILATTTIGVTSNPSASFTLPIPLQDADYPAFAYIYDEHGHEALANPRNQNYTINNVAPFVLNGNIDLNQGDDMLITNPGGETTGFVLDFTITDNNGCLTAASTTDEIRGYYVSVFRNGIGTSSCDAAAADYDPNNCYTNGVATTTWNLSCTATTTCQNATQKNMSYTCSFPLWFVAEPTGSSTLPTAWITDYWTAGVAAYDNNAATGTVATSSSPVDVGVLSALDVLSADIAYGALEPGDNNPFLTSTSTIISLGNTGLDQEVEGESMCSTFAIGNECPSNPNSTVPEWRQQFSSTSPAYDTSVPRDVNIGDGVLSSLQFELSSSTQQELELNVRKATTTSLATVTRGTTFWGIKVPGSITLAGTYTGLNTFYAVMAEPVDWQ